MASWNNTYGLPNWQGNGNNIKARNLKVSSITADTIRTNELFASTISSLSLYSDVINALEVNTSTLRGSNIYGYNNYLDYIQNINIATNVITLDEQGLTATPSGLYLNGNLIGTPSTISSIADWSQFKAVTNVDMANSTIRNILGLSSVYLSTGSIRANGINTNTITANTANLTTLSSSNINAYNVVLSNQITVPQISSVFISTGVLQADTIIANIGDYQDIVVSNIVADVATSRILNSRVGLISSCGIDFLSSGRIRGAFGTFSTFEANTFSTAYLTVSSFRASNAVINTLITDNIFNTYTINTSNLTSVGLINASNVDVSGTLVVDGVTTANGNIVFNGNMTGNSDIYFQVNNSEVYGDQYLHDIHNLRNLYVEKITVLGGWTGNDIIPPYYNDSIVQVGENGVRPGQVTISGFNPDPLDTGIALTVDGDTQMTQNLNVLGLTTCEGDLTVVGVTSLNGEVNVTGLATFEADIDVLGLATFEGAVNIAGALGVEGETNLAGAVTCEAGIGIAGALGLTGGDATFGSAIDSHTFTNYYYTNIKNNANVDSNLTVGGTLTANNINITNGYISSLNTSTINTSTLNTFTLNLLSNVPISPPYTAWDSNTLYNTGDFANYNSINYVATATNKNNPPTGPIPLWYPFTPYDQGNVVRVTGVGDYVCTVSYSGGPTPPNGDFSHWVPSLSVLWNFDSYTEGVAVSHINGDNQSYINIGYVSTLNTVSKNLSSYTGYISSLKNNSLIGDSVNVSTLYASTIVNQELASYKIYNSSINTQEIIIDNSNNAFITFKDMSNNDLGIVGRPEGTNDIFALASFKILSLQSVQQTNIQSIESVGIQAPNILLDGNTSVSNGVLNMFSTLYLNSNDVKHVSSLSYTSVDSTYDYPTYVGGQIQHWDASGGSYDYYIPQLWYSDISNNSNCAIASDWSYYPCKNLYVNMNSNFINNCGGVFTNQVIMPQASSQANGYTGTGIIFGQESGDSVFWQLVKPKFTDLSGTPEQGTEGVYITTRSTSNGAMTALGRLYDDAIYTPWANVTGNLNMNTYNISNVNRLIGSNISVSNVSTINISTSALRANNISTLFLTNQSTIYTSTIATDRIVGLGNVNNIFTNNLFPIGAGSQLGFFGSGGTNSGGFYNNINVRSTNTQVLTPDVVGAFSNNIRVQGNLSTQNVFVSSINNKLYPYTSTLNIPFSTFRITGTQATTPIVLYSNVDFRTQGFHRLTQKAILSKNTGGTSADLHANIFYSVGTFPSTPSITDGYSSLPYINQDGRSSFTTCVTEFFVSTPTTRNICYYDSAGNNYSASLFMGTLFDSYTPSFGINPERIPSIL